MSEVLLVGVDRSECSIRALEYAADQAERSTAQLVVAHVIEWSPYLFDTPQENEVRHQRREAELARASSETVDPLVTKLRDRGISARGAIRHGHVAETLAELARECSATGIIIGKTGSSRIRAQLFGSVPNTLVQVSSLPVTIVP
jgi:nucleotide-binding universal stress UspA family protein